MFLVHFIENKTKVLSQLLNNIPTLDEEIKIKGRKGKIIGVNNEDENVINVNVVFEQVKKAAKTVVDKKKRR
jgi:nitrate reductase NapAB chaperone NapD